MAEESAGEIKLTWDDLIVDRVTPEEAGAWLAEWRWLGLGRIAPIFLSRFGDWFFRRPDGSVHVLAVTEGVVEQVAPDGSAFQAAVNTLAWQEKFLCSALVLHYRRQGVVALGRQAIGLAPHPVFVDSLDKCKATVLDMVVWQSICAQTMRRVGVWCDR